MSSTPSSELRHRKGTSDTETNPTISKNDAVKEPTPTPPKASESPRQKMITRTLVGLPMVFGALLTISSNYAPYIFSALVFIIQLISFREVTNVRYKAAKEMKIPYFRTVNWWFLFVTIFFFYGNAFFDMLSRFHADYSFFNRYHIGISYSLYIFGFILFVLSLKADLYRYQFTQFAWMVMTLVMFVIQSHFIFYNIFEGLFWFVHPVSLIVSNDTFAYFTGMLFGRKIINRPFLKLSPNKTWEGFIGGSICTLIWSYWWCTFLLNSQWVQCPIREWNFETNSCSFINPVFLYETFTLPSTLAYFLGQTTISIAPIYIHSFVFTIFASFIAPFGGFFASGMKRAHGIKDFDSIFPGHGGMTDRMDCQLVMAMFVFVYFHTFIGTGQVEVSRLLRQISLLSLQEQIDIFRSLNQTLSLN